MMSGEQIGPLSFKVFYLYASCPCHITFSRPIFLDLPSEQISQNLLFKGPHISSLVFNSDIYYFYFFQLNCVCVDFIFYFFYHVLAVPNLVLLGKFFFMSSSTSLYKRQMEKNTAHICYVAKTHSGVFGGYLFHAATSVPFFSLEKKRQ